MNHRTRRPGRTRHSGKVGYELRAVRGNRDRTGITVPERGAASGTSSPVITQERVIGSLRSSMHKETICIGVASTVICAPRFAPGRAGCVCYNPRTKPPEMTEPSTPLMRQYAAIKKEHPSALLFFRLGDFYELFFDDAILASRELQITLTSRNKEKGVAVPMCGVPYHAAEGYISKLIRKGFKVAICEQMENPAPGQEIGATRGHASGHAGHGRGFGAEFRGKQLPRGAWRRVGDRVGFAALDLSTGEFRATEFSGEDAGKRIQEELQQLRPKGAVVWLVGAVI